MVDDPQELQEPKRRKDGQEDGRGRGSGSRASQYASGDGRARPGRPKGAKNKKTKRRAVLDIPTVVTFGGKRRRVDTETALLMKQREKGLNGDSRAAELLLGKQAPEPEQPDQDFGSLMAEDLDILADAYARGLLSAALPAAGAEVAPSGADNPREEGQG